MNYLRAYRFAWRRLGFVKASFLALGVAIGRGPALLSSRKAKIILPAIVIVPSLFLLLRKGLTAHAHHGQRA